VDSLPDGELGVRTGETRRLCHRGHTSFVLMRDLYVNASGLMILGLRQDYKRFHGCNVLWYASSSAHGSVALGVLMNANRL
jgi:hypothetical protein